MAKLVTLRLMGNLLQQGYAVIVDISHEGQRPYAEEIGYLPPRPELAATLTHHWHNQYRNVLAPSRFPLPLIAPHHD